MKLLGGQFGLHKINPLLFITAAESDKSNVSVRQTGDTTERGQDL